MPSMYSLYPKIASVLEHIENARVINKLSGKYQDYAKAGMTVWDQDEHTQWYHVIDKSKIQILVKKDLNGITFYTVSFNCVTETTLDWKSIPSDKSQPKLEQYCKSGVDTRVRRGEIGLNCDLIYFEIHSDATGLITSLSVLCNPTAKTIESVHFYYKWSPKNPVILSRKDAR